MRVFRLRRSCQCCSRYQPRHEAISGLVFLRILVATHRVLPTNDCLEYGMQEDKYLSTGKKLKHLLRHVLFVGLSLRWR